MAENTLMVQVILLAFAGIMVFSIFVSPRYKVQYFSVSTILVFPGIGIYFVYPLLVSHQLGGLLL